MLLIFVLDSINYPIVKLLTTVLSHTSPTLAPLAHVQEEKNAFAFIQVFLCSFPSLIPRGCNFQKQPIMIPIQ